MIVRLNRPASKILKVGGYSKMRNGENSEFLYDSLMHAATSHRWYLDTFPLLTVLSGNV